MGPAQAPVRAGPRGAMGASPRQQAPPTKRASAWRPFGVVDDAPRRVERHAQRPMPWYSKPSAFIASGSYRLRPSKMTGCFSIDLTIARFGLL